VSLLRSISFGILLLVFLATAFAANLGFWAINSVLDAQAFVSVADRVLDDPAVRGYIGDQIAAQTVDLVVSEMGRVPPALAAQLGLPSGANQGQIQAGLSRAVQGVLAQPAVQSILDDALRGLHGAVTGTGGVSTVSVQGDTIVLDLDQVVAVVDQQIDPSQPGFFGVPIPANLGSVPLFRSDAVAIVVDAARVADTVRWLLPVVALGCCFLVLLFARRRIAALAWIGLCLFIVGLTCIGLVTVAAPVVAAALSPGIARAAIPAAITDFTSALVFQSAVLAAVGVVLVVAGAFGGALMDRRRTMSFH
jgi:hypothetical protein